MTWAIALWKSFIRFHCIKFLLSLSDISVKRVPLCSIPSMTTIITSASPVGGIVRTVTTVAASNVNSGSKRGPPPPKGHVLVMSSGGTTTVATRPPVTGN